MSLKVQALIRDECEPFEYGNTCGRELVEGCERLRVGVNDRQDRCVQLLGAGLSGPFQFLYVLHTTRTGADLGRYESPELDASAIAQFLERFGRYLSEDARHDVWLRSHDDDATIVLDRHNLIYAYGPLEAFEAALLKIGVRRGTLPEVPGPHVHHYYREWDGYEREILQTFPWVIKPLRPSDVQWHGDTGPG